MRVLYLCYDGLLEPLGQSQVLAYLEKLAAAHRITLITFEKPADLARLDAMAAMQARCAAAGIRWVARRYRHRPRLLATLVDLTVFAITAFREARRGGAELIHARSYIPCFVALGIGWLLGRPFIFDMRAFWPDEMVSAGRLKRASPIYRSLKRAELICLRRAAAVVSLTEAAVNHLSGLAGLGHDRVRYAVIPTCADVDRFQPRADRDETGIPQLFGTTGTVVGGWFLLDWLFAFWSAALEQFPRARFQVISRDSDDAIRTAGAAWPEVLQRLEIAGRPPALMPETVMDFDVAAMFFTPDFSKLGSCPTRMGEMLACGCPVVANDSVGDVGAIIRRYRVGVVVTDNSVGAMRHAAAELAELLRDPDLSRRCRMAAEDWFALEKGVQRYDRLYREIGETRVKKADEEIDYG